MEIRNVPVGEIKIGFTHRRDLGDLKALAESIEKEGLLQAIGVTPDLELVFGKRRFFACKDILHWTEIPCRIVDVSSLLTGQYVENEMRKDFTPSERDSIRRALELEAGTRQGQRTDLMATASQRDGASGPQVVQEKAASGSNGKPASVVADGTLQARPGETTRDLTARLAGFSNTTEARRVRKIMDQGAAELIQAVDEKKLCISVAAAIADLPKPEQVRVLAAGKEAIGAVLGFRPRRTKDSKGQREVAAVPDKAGASTACMVESVPEPAPGPALEEAAGDVERCRCGGEWTADGDGARFCVECKAAHPGNAIPDEGAETAKPGAHYPLATLKIRSAALHKMEQELGRSRRQLDYLGLLFGQGDHYRSMDWGLRMACRRVDDWKRVLLPAEYWDHPPRARGPRKPR